MSPRPQGSQYELRQPRFARSTCGWAPAAPHRFSGSRVKAAVVIGAVLTFVLAGWAVPVSAADDPGKQRLWWFLNPPLGNPDIAKIVIDPNNDSLWYVTSWSGGLYITRNASGSWEQHLSGNVGAVAIDPRFTFAVYASSGSDLYWSVDSGVTWNLLFSFPNPIPGVPDSSTFIDSIMVSAVDSAVVVGLSSMFHSTRVYASELDGGTVVWNPVWESPEGLHIWSIAEDPGNGTWFFSTEDNDHTVNPAVMRSTDRGATWQEMAPLTGYLTAGHGLNLAVHPATRRVYFLTESSTLYTSDDSGNTWSPGIYVDFGNALLLDPACPNRVFGGELVRGLKPGGAYFSQTGGQSFWWEGPSDSTISSLALMSSGTAVVAVASGAGFWYQDFGTDIPCTDDLPFFADGFNIDGDLRRWSAVVGGP